MVRILCSPMIGPRQHHEPPKSSEAPTRSQVSWAALVFHLALSLCSHRDHAPAFSLNVHKDDTIPRGNGIEAFPSFDNNL